MLETICKGLRALQALFTGTLFETAARVKPETVAADNDFYTKLPDTEYLPTTIPDGDEWGITIVASKLNANTLYYTTDNPITAPLNNALQIHTREYRGITFVCDHLIIRGKEHVVATYTDPAGEEWYSELFKVDLNNYSNVEEQACAALYDRLTQLRALQIQ